MSWWVLNEQTDVVPCGTSSQWSTKETSLEYINTILTSIFRIFKDSLEATWNVHISKVVSCLETMLPKGKIQPYLGRKIWKHDKWNSSTFERSQRIETGCLSACMCLCLLSEVYWVVHCLSCSPVESFFSWEELVFQEQEEKRGVRIKGDHESVNIGPYLFQQWTVDKKCVHDYFTYRCFSKNTGPSETVLPNVYIVLLTWASNTTHTGIPKRRTQFLSAQWKRLTKPKHHKVGHKGRGPSDEHQWASKRVYLLGARSARL